jgi:hypothetical protein
VGTEGNELPRGVVGLEFLPEEMPTAADASEPLAAAGTASSLVNTRASFMKPANTCSYVRPEAVRCARDRKVSRISESERSEDKGTRTIAHEIELAQELIDDAPDLLHVASALSDTPIRAQRG